MKEDVILGINDKLKFEAGSGDCQNVNDLHFSDKTISRFWGGRIILFQARSPHVWMRMVRAGASPADGNDPSMRGECWQNLHYWRQWLWAVLQGGERKAIKMIEHTAQNYSLPGFQKCHENESPRFGISYILELFEVFEQSSGVMTVTWNIFSLSHYFPWASRIIPSIFINLYRVSCRHLRFNRIVMVVIIDKAFSH